MENGRGVLEGDVWQEFGGENCWEMVFFLRPSEAFLFWQNRGRNRGNFQTSPFLTCHAFGLAAFLFCNLGHCASSTIFTCFIDNWRLKNQDKAWILGRRSNSSGQAKMKSYVMLGHFSVTSAPSFTVVLSSLGTAPGWVSKVLITRNCGEANGSCAAWMYLHLRERQKRADGNT